MMNMLLTASKTYLTQTEYLFHCNFKVKVPLQYGEILLHDCFDLLRTVDRTYNSYQQYSFFDLVNRNAGHWVDIDGDCHGMLETLLKVSAHTNGAYDISCMPLLRLWGFYRSQNQRTPTYSEIKDVLSKVGYRSIELEKERVRIPVGYELVTGSFIKSFAVDKLVQFLKSKGITDAVINAGGSTIFGLNDSSHKSWKVNIPDPMDKSITSSNQIVISNKCFSFSARTNNHIVIQGKEYGHIFNSAIGYPVPTLQVGVWSNTAFLGDVLSTAIFCTEQDKLPITLKRLKHNFQFDCYRIEENGIKTTDICF